MTDSNMKARPFFLIMKDKQTALLGRQQYQQEILNKIYQDSIHRTDVNFQLRPGETSRNCGITSFDLETKQNRFLLTSLGTPPYNLSIYDTLDSPRGGDFFRDTRSVFKLVRCKEANPFSLFDYGSYSRIQWYPTDTGIFTTSSCYASKIQVWNTEKMKIAEEIDAKIPVKYHEMNKNGIGAIATHEGVQLVDLRTGSSTHKTAHKNKKAVNTVKWHPAQSNIVTAGYSNGEICLWDIRSSKEPLPLLSKVKSDSPVSKLSFCPNNRTLVSVHGQMLKFWDTFDIARGERSLLFERSNDIYFFADTRRNCSNCVAVSSKSNLIFIFQHCELLTYDYVKRKLHVLPVSCPPLSYTDVILDEFGPNRFLTLDELGTVDVLSFGNKEFPYRSMRHLDSHNDTIVVDKDHFLPKSSLVSRNNSKGVKEKKKLDQRRRTDKQNVGDNSHHVRETGTKNINTSSIPNSTNARKENDNPSSSQSKVYEKKLSERNELWDKYLKESKILSRMLLNSAEEGLPDEWSSEEG